ncbi:MAG TPA: dihydrolipoamide acetyltransferase family protein [candidate division Zixibacteria bacterium]|jgi:2-oxoglutarate dehydrogenase E2 component (dihydrolipoamide succinyltransferase)
MPQSIVVPQMGESVVEGTVGRWLKSEGDPIDKDETVVEIMTDKVNVELPAIAGGTLGKILVPEGTVVSVGTEIGIILEKGESLPSNGGRKSGVVAKSASGGTSPLTTMSTTTTVTKPTPEAESDDGMKKSSPVVRRLLREHGLTLAEIPSTGAGGRVSKQDVLDYIRDRKPASAPGAGTFPRPPEPQRPVVPSAAFTMTTSGSREEKTETLPLAGVRKLIAEHMVKSKQTSPHVMTMDEVDLTELVRIRNEKKDEWRQKVGANVTYLPFFMKAAIAALKEFPTLNASIQGDKIILRKYYHLGMAVGRDVGLIVPVIKFADQKSIAQIAREAAELSDRARREKLKPEEVSGSTFTFTNAGMYGALASTPVINQPEVAILGMHLIQKRPVVRDDQIVIRDMMYVTLSFDHRLVDGHTAVQFVRRICERLENPWELMLTIG